MRELEIVAPAKVNLFLHVLRRRPDGYHDILTCFEKVSLCDRLKLRKSVEIALEVKGPERVEAGRSNLCFRAAAAFFERASVEGGVFITLEKNIPAGAGLGGGSSDAAAVLKGLSRLYPGQVSEAELFELGRSLGADVCFFLSPWTSALGWGIGDRLKPTVSLRATYLLAIPPFRVSTAWAYQNLRLTKRKSPLNNEPEIFSWEGFFFNEFEGLVFERYPVLAEVKRKMLDLGALGASLSGTGSAVFAAFSERTLAIEAEERLKKAFPSMRFVTVTTYGEEEGCS